MDLGPAQSDFDEAALSGLLEVARRLALPVDLDELLAGIISAGCRMLGADRGSVLLYDPPRHELYACVASGGEAIRFPADQGLAGECARTRRIINVSDCYADPRFNRAVDRDTGYRTRNLLSIPLIGLDETLVGVLQLLNAAKGCFDRRDERVAEALAAQAAVALQRARLIEDRMVRLKLERDLDLAREIQQAVLATELPPCAGYDLAVFNRAPEATGGDIYDVLRRPGLEDDPRAPLWLLLADATGHGIGPALAVTQARAMVRMAVRLGTSLDELVDQLNRRILEDTRPGRFVTAFLGRLDPHTHQVTYHAAGQGPIAHYQAATGVCRFLDASTLPLGILPELPLQGAEPLVLDPGDLLVLLTDGFYERRAADPRHPFGTEGVRTVLEREHRAGAAAILDALVQAQDDFAQGQPQDDDLTALVVKRLPCLPE